MEFLVLWLGTIIASFCMEIVHELRMFKDVADAGYKIDIKRFSEFADQINAITNAKKKTFLSMLIPIYNMMKVCERTIQYNNIRPIIIDQLNTIGVLEEMSEIEKTEYKKNPTGLNAIIVLLNSERRLLLNVKSIEFKEGNEHGEIYYEIGNPLHDITILKVTGSASRLTTEEQKKKVMESLYLIAQAGIEKYGDQETFLNAILHERKIDLDSSEEEKKMVPQTSQELAIEEQKQTLENLKNELLEEQEVMQSAQANKQFTKSNNRK